MVMSAHHADLMYGSYDLLLVGLSILIAILASYAALDLASQLTTVRGWKQVAWLSLGAIAMGTGIWAMHFIGMLAFHMTLPVGYHLGLVMVSVAAAVVVSGVALFLASRTTVNSLVFWGGSICMGLGISTMHYLGMAAMQVPATMHYDLRIVALSNGIAIAVSMAALWLVFKLREDKTMKGTCRRLGGAVLMGFAIASMHYTGMAAVTFMPLDTEVAPSFFVLNASSLAGVIGLVTFVILGLTLLTSSEWKAVKQFELFTQSQAIAQSLHVRTEQLERALSELKQTQLHLVQQEKMSALGNLVAGIGHEINNPVGFIAGNLNPALTYVTDLFDLIDLYQKHMPQPMPEIVHKIEDIDLEYVRDDLPKLIRSMQVGIQRIRDISSSLRTFARADHDQKTAFDIHAGLDSTLLILQHRLKATPTRPAIEIVKQYGEIPTVACFVGQLNQVFINLLANAIDALEEASTQRSPQELQANPNRIVIQTGVVNEGRSVSVRIADNGVGMPDEVKQHIFDHLFTTKPVGKGTGLGLAIAHQIIVDKHGGTLTVNSTLGQGTEFVCTLPTLSATTEPALSTATVA